MLSVGIVLCFKWHLTMSDFRNDIINLLKPTGYYTYHQL